MDFDPKLLNKSDTAYDQIYLDAILEGKFELLPVLEVLESLPETWLNVKTEKFDFKNINYYLRSIKTSPQDIVNSLANLDKLPNIIYELLYSCGMKNNQIILLNNLACNINIPSHILEKLSKHKSHVIRSSVANNPNASLTIMKELANDDTSWVRSFVAAKTTSTEILEKLCKDTEFLGYGIGEALSRNKHTPASILLKLLPYSTESICYNIAIHPNATKKILNKLAEHSSEYVRGVVLRRLKTG